MTRWTKIKYKGKKLLPWLFQRVQAFRRQKMTSWLNVWYVRYGREKEQRKTISTFTSWRQENPCCTRCFHLQSENLLLLFPSGSSVGQVQFAVGKRLGRGRLIALLFSHYKNKAPGYIFFLEIAFCGRIRVVNIVFVVALVFYRLSL